MGKSLKEYLAALGYWSLLVIAPIALDIVGILQLASSNQFTGIPSWIWFQIAFVFLLIIPFIAFHKLRIKIDEKQNELDKIKDKRPTIETTVRNQIHNFDVEITNKGEGAEFEAQVEILHGKTSVLGLPNNYSAYWERTKTDKTELKRGGKDWLKIASLNVMAMSLKYCLHYYDITHFEGSTCPRINSADSSSWIPGNNQIVQPDIILRVTICSKPSMIDGVFVLTYALTVGGLSEVNS